MKHFPKLYLHALLALLAYLSICCSVAIAELRPVEWTEIQQTLDCNGKTIVIDAITDFNIPSEACEWTATAHEWTEEELREFVAVASPGDENMPRVDEAYPGIRLINDDIEIALAVADSGIVTVEHAGLSRRYDGGTLGEASFAILDEPFYPAVPSLTLFSFDEAMGRLQPVLDALGLDIGQPYYAEAWDAESLNKNNEENYKRAPDYFKNIYWTAKDEIYEMKLPVYYNGIRLYPYGGRLYKNLWVAYTGVNCTIDASQLLYLQANNCYFENVTPINETQPILTLESAIKCFQQIKEDMSWEDELIVDKILLEYIVLENDTTSPVSYWLIPAWCFYHKHMTERGLYYTIDKIHALTGEPLDF